MENGPDRLPCSPSGTGTRKKALALVFGIVLPIFCLAADPIVFKGSLLLGESPMFADLRIPAYVFCAIECALMALWLALGRRPAWLSSFLGGGLIVGGAASLLLGLALLPSSLVAILVVIGVFGLTPIVTALVYFEQGIEAVIAASRSAGKGLVRACALAGAAFCLAVPLGIHYVVSKVVNGSLSELRSEDDQTVEAAVARLTRWRLAYDTDRLAFAWRDTDHPALRERLARAYLEVTGKDVQSRLDELSD
jgi:hypothetical protein